MRLFIGHDLGTSCNKTVLIDAKGQLRASHVAQYPLSHPRLGWAQQEPEHWWQAVCAGCRAVTQCVEPGSIGGMAFAGQMLTLVPMDASGTPTRPAISWLDHRADDVARSITRRFGGKAVVQKLAAGVPTGKDLVAKIAWLQIHEPEVHRATAAYGDATSYLVARSTGKIGLDVTAAGGTGLYGGRKRQWSTLLARLVGLPLDRMPSVRPCTEIAGPLIDSAAEALGLPVGLPIAMGMADIPSAALGSGAIKNGQGHVYLGTSSWIVVAVDRERHVPSAGIASVPTAVATGVYPNLEAAAARVQIDRDIQPIPGSDAIYRPLFEAYRQLVPAFRRVSKQLERCRQEDSR